MRKLLQISIALILFNNISTQISAQTTCKPLFKSIFFNYNVGDVYTYKKTEYDATGGWGWTVTSSFFSFEIKNKIIKNDSLIYIIDGLFPATSVTKENYSYEDFTFTDTIVLIDSLSHILNLCSDTIVEFISSPFEKYFTKALINPTDSSQKILGGYNNL